MRIKELAHELNVSKTTVSNVIRSLNIEPEKVGNRFVLSAADVERIKTALISDKSQSENAKNENNAKFANNAKNTNQDEKNAQENAKNANQNTKNANENANQQLIDMLQKALEDKENTIRKQLETIDTLTKTNAVLTTKIAFLEDKSKPEPEVITPDEGTTKIRWWQKIFNT